MRLPTSSRPCWVIAAGKAANAMATAAVDILGSRVRGGLIVSPGGPAPEMLDAIVGEHPQPGDGSEAGGRRALAIAEAVPADAELMVLLSGGASSLLAVPAEGISLDDKRATTGVLLKAGADIYALNTVRKHVSAIKGGRLAAVCRAESHTFVLSDVVGDDLSFIASGPTVADRSTYADALAVVDRFGGRSAYPAAVVAHLKTGAAGGVPESPKPGDPRLARAETVLIGGRHDAMAGAAAHARRRGYAVHIIEEAITGEARAAGPLFARSALEHARALPRPCCVVASGETTVHVTGSGLGGRNQELALAAAEVLAGYARPAALASIGTDGIDGPTDAAGGVVDQTTIDRMTSQSRSLTAVLGNNDSYGCLDALEDLIRTGATGTNVGDLQILLLA
jgi:glycerate 2-kinase